MAVRSRLFAGAGALVVALAIGACGEDDFENEPRPASPIELTALINDREVKVSPRGADRVGAGLVSIVISNQADDPSALVLEGPTDGASDEIPAGGTGSMTLDLAEGEYIATAESLDVRDATLNVGAPRESAQNELLLP
jgi:hypothetical protein